jgi:adenylate cyclase
VSPGFPQERFLARSYQGLESIQLKLGAKTLAIPVDERVAALVPFRGNGGPKGGSFRYVSAADLLSKAMPGREFAEGQDRAGGYHGARPARFAGHPVGEIYPGVEAHANVISGLLDGKILVKPDYAIGYEVVVLLLAGLVLAFALPLVTATRAVVLSVVVLPWWRPELLDVPGFRPGVAAGGRLVMCLTAFALNMSYGYFVESRSKRELANLFGTYVPPELVDEMVKDPDSYSMQATNRQMTVMFCDMRGFTKMSEHMEPISCRPCSTRCSAG